MVSDDRTVIAHQPLPPEQFEHTRLDRPPREPGAAAASPDDTSADQRAPGHEPTRSTAPPPPVDDLPTEGVSRAAAMKAAEALAAQVGSSESAPGLPIVTMEDRAPNLSVEIDSDRVFPELEIEPRPPSRRGKATGELFGEYELLGAIGQGGMAAVRFAYRRRTDGTKRPCVIKLINEDLIDDEEYVEMFREEARIGALLSHPNIVQFIDAGEVGRIPYIAFELVDGMTALQMVKLAKPERLPIDVVVEIGRPIAEALAYAHALTGPRDRPLSLVHRDVTPQNILISRVGQVKLSDFGIARFEGRDHQTTVGFVKGKLRYLSTEQLRGGRIDGRADLFGLGVVIAELLIGRPLIVDGILAANDVPALIRKRCGSKRPEAPAPLIDLLAHMTEREPEDRPETAAVVADALARLQADLPRSRGLKAVTAELYGQLPQKIPAADEGAGIAPPVDEVPDVADPSERQDTVEGPPGVYRNYPTSIAMMFPDLTEASEGDADSEQGYGDDDDEDFETLPATPALYDLINEATPMVRTPTPTPAPPPASALPQRPEDSEAPTSSALMAVDAQPHLPLGPAQENTPATMSAADALAPMVMPPPVAAETQRLPIVVIIAGIVTVALAVTVLVVLFLK